MHLLQICALSSDGPYFAFTRVRCFPNYDILARYIYWRTSQTWRVRWLHPDFTHWNTARASSILKVIQIVMVPIYPSASQRPISPLCSWKFRFFSGHSVLMEKKNTLHATAMVVFQRKTDFSPELSLDLTKHPTCKSLPSSSIPNAERLPCHVPSNAQPKYPQYGRLDTTPSPDIRCRGARWFDMVGRAINGKITIRQSEDPHVGNL